MDPQRDKIIYVDDEMDNLVAFKALLRMDYDIFTCLDPSEAADYLKENEVKVIFSDQMMPEVTGVEFFEAIRPMYPYPIRVLITGYSDMHAVVDAINQGEIYRYVAKPWDSTELKICIKNCIDKYDREKELRNKNVELEKALRELEKFVYSASHDLKAPISSIKGVLNVARLNSDPAQSVEYFGMIERSIDKLSDFVINIIHYYQNMKTDNVIEEANMNDILDEIKEKYKYFDGANNLVLSKDVSQSSEFKVDTYRLRMVLQNVVSNAIKYRDKEKEMNKVEITVVQNKERGIIKVTDNGVGIDKDLLPNVFNMFIKGDKENVGVGVGLYIAAEAVRKMNGKISLQSEMNKGTTVTIDVPNKA